MSNNDLGPAPVSAPPFGSIPMNPFAVGFQPQNSVGPPTGMIPHTGGLPVHPGPPPAAVSSPQFYLIPASNVTHTQAGIAFVTGSSNAHNPVLGAPHPMPPPLPPPMMTPTGMPGGMPSATGPLTPGALSAGLVPTPSYSPPDGGLILNAIPPTIWPKGAVIKPSGRFSKPTKVPGKNQYRDEVVIRNADSGKIMGMRGRRIALIEEMSKTVVSFQKVPHGAKERTLTITGPTEESIEQAKGLVDQTIRRNASPNREEGSESGDLILRSTSEAENLEEMFSEMKMSEEDIIGLTCSNPKLLQAAKDALREYFERHGHLRRSHTDSGITREERKERRKSMPPISQQQGGGNPGDAQMSPPLTDEGAAGDGFISPMANVATVTFSEPGRTTARQKRFQSTPNLAQVPEEQVNGIGTPKTPKSPLTPMLSDPEKYPILRPGAGGDTIYTATNEVPTTPKKFAPSSPSTPGSGNTRVVYTRDFVLQCSASPLAKTRPEGVHVSKEGDEPSPDFILETPLNFDHVAFKETAAALKQRAQLFRQHSSPSGSGFITPITPTQFVFG